MMHDSDKEISQISTITSHIKSLNFTKHSVSKRYSLNGFNGTSATFSKGKKQICKNK